MLSPSTELTGFRMVIVVTTPRHFVRSSTSSFTTSFICCLFWSSSTTVHFKFQAFTITFFIFFLQNMTVPLHATCFRHPIQRLLYIQYLNCRGETGGRVPPSRVSVFHRDLASSHRDLDVPHRDLNAG